VLVSGEAASQAYHPITAAVVENLERGGVAIANGLDEIVVGSRIRLRR
jgi:hypothetical protein